MFREPDAFLSFSTRLMFCDSDEEVKYCFFLFLRFGQYRE